MTTTDTSHAPAAASASASKMPWIDEPAMGLGADWLNGWLAAVGVTVLVPEARLAWNLSDPPRAVFSWPSSADDTAPGLDLADLIAQRLPTVDEMDTWIIAGLPQGIPLEQYQEVARQAREQPDRALGLALSTTDATQDAVEGKGLAKMPFNVGAPRGETLFRRLRACRARLADGSELAASVRATLAGRGERAGLNGLGFDYRRIAASVPGEGVKRVDPVVECLCFYGLLLHPAYADGRSGRQRGWRGRASQPEAYLWPSWKDPLDRWAIDALLGRVYSDAADRSGPISSQLQGSGRDRLPRSWRRWGVTALYGTAPFQSVGSADTTRGYGSRRVV